MGSASSSRSKFASGSGAARDAKGRGGAAVAAAPAPSSSSSEGCGRSRAAATAAVEACPCDNCGLMKASPCREQYIKKYHCSQVALDAGEHPDQLCTHVAKDLDRCIEANRFYYRLLDRAEEI